MAAGDCGAQRDGAFGRVRSPGELAIASTAAMTSTTTPITAIASDGRWSGPTRRSRVATVGAASA